jgi:23S rRNA G2069 N7-methylase RlmK/C1962 C5-methylase RlmI
MPTLDNPKHERFAQCLAKGMTQEEAYQEAGYKPDRGAASRLSANVNVQGRVAEILERAATRAEVTVADLTDRLMVVAKKAEDLGEASGLSVARAAFMDVAKLNGLVIDRSKSEAVIRTLGQALDELDAEG